MEGLSTLQVKHEDGLAPRSFCSRLYPFTLFFTDEEAPFVLVHKEVSGMVLGGFLELLKDNGTGSPVV